MNADICMGCFEPLNGFDVCGHCGWHRDAVPEHAYHLHPGTVLYGRYIVGNTVGVGGFGITYRAWDSTLNSLVAIKEFYPAGLVNRVPGEKEIVVFSGEKKEQFDLSIARFLSEARTMAKFTGHPDIVHVFDFFEENNTAYIVMEFLDGVNLKQYLESLPEKKMQAEEAVDIVVHILDALSEMHSKKIIHRDISPDNIQLTTDNKIKIFDFGAAKLTKEDTEETRSIVVKTGYTPPEQYRAKSKQGAFTDLYSVGAVLYKLITGITPDESVDRVVEDTLKKPSKQGAQIDQNLEKVIMKSLALKHELRFQNASQFKDAILNKKTVDFPEIELKKRRRMRVIITSLLCLFTIVFSVAFGMYVTREHDDPLMCDNGSIDILIPVSDDEAVAKDQTEMYEKIVAKFIERAKEPTEKLPEGNKFEVKLDTVPQGKYFETLMTRINEGNAPDVFSTDLFGDDKGDFAANLDLLVEGTSEDECIILDEYEEAYPGSLEMPTGFYSTIVYANQAAARSAGTEIPASIDNVSELFEKAETKNNVYAVAISPDNVDDTIMSIIDTELYDRKNDSFSPKAEDAFMTIGNSTYRQGFNYADNGIQALYDNKLVYYIDDTNALAAVREKLPGYYTALPILNNGKIIVTTTKHLGVSKTADENTQKIAMQFIRFMLTDYSQDLMHIQNNIALPLNRGTVTNYLAYNGDIGFLSNYLDKMVINGSARQKCYYLNTKLYDEIMTQNGDYSNIKNYLNSK